MLQEIVLELTDCCALDCLHCSTNSGLDSRNFLDNHKAKQLVKEASNLGAKQVSFGGGEPFCSPILIDIVSLALTYNMLVEIFSSGAIRKGNEISALDEKKLDSLPSSSKIKIIFSIHAADQKLNDAISQISGSYYKLLESIKRCQAKDIRCELNFVPCKINYRNFQDIVKLAEKLNIDRISILRFVPQGRGKLNREKLELTIDEENEFIENILKLRKLTNISIRTGSPFNNIIPDNHIPCRAGSGKLVVQADGNVIPCEVFKDEHEKKWNLSVYDRSLEEILNSEGLVMLRQELKKSNRLDCPMHSKIRSEKIGAGLINEIS